MKGRHDKIGFSIHCKEGGKPTTKPIRLVQGQPGVDWSGMPGLDRPECNEISRVLKKLHPALDRLDHPSRS